MSERASELQKRKWDRCRRHSRFTHTRQKARCERIHTHHSLAHSVSSVSPSLFFKCLNKKVDLVYIISFSPRLNPLFKLRIASEKKPRGKETYLMFSLKFSQVPTNARDDRRQGRDSLFCVQPGIISLECLSGFTGIFEGKKHSPWN